MAGRKPSVNIIDLFRTKLHDLTIIPERSKEGWQGPPFIRGRALTTWLRSSANDHQPVSHARLLLAEAFLDYENPLPISDDDILLGVKRCPLMFCILLEIGCGSLIYDLYRYGINDGCLPMAPSELSEHFHEAFQRHQKLDIEAVAAAFNYKQWAYFPLPISRGMRPMPLAIERILPICQRSKINSKGGTAQLHMIAIPEEFIDDELKQVVDASAFQHEKYDRCYQFALKSFINQSHGMFEAEINAYKHLQNQKHVIKCFGGFSHFGEEDNCRTHSLLLEYGECDLTEYFRSVNPPALTDDIENFWAELFKVAKVLKEIHSFKAPRGAIMEVYDGWHGDIKPDNILMSEEQLKLADPGFVNFVRSNNSQNKTGTLRILNGWTSTYGPPELKGSKSGVAEPWAVDIWSLACVISEAATWIILANTGRHAYSLARQQAISNLSLNPQPSVSEDDELGRGDFFHNGTSVLPAVTQWHQMLRTMIRPTDRITGAILDLVDKHLLVTDPTKRMRAKTLCNEFAKIRTTLLQSRLPDAVPHEFKHFIKEARDMTLDTYISPSQINGDLSVEDRKAGNFTPSAIQSWMSRSSQTIKQSRYQSQNPARPPQTPTGGNRNDPHNSQNSDLYLSQSMDSVPKKLQRTPTAQQATERVYTIFDAFYDRKAAEGRGFRRLTRPATRTKDQRLSSYYKNRDIVFLVDNAGTMSQFWREVKFTLTELAGIARNQDDDGMDLRFTRSTKTVSGAKDAVNQFATAMDLNEVQPQLDVSTNMAESLGELLFGWRDEFRRRPSTTKSMTIIVLTDGRWAMTNENDEYAVDYKIIRFSKSAEQLPDFRDRERRVSIQFVSFGQDPFALARLQRLDDSLRYENIEDIVDTEPSSGDVYNMLLGSFVPEIDERNTSFSASEASPPSLQWTSTSNFSLISPLTSGASDMSMPIPRTHHNHADPRSSRPENVSSPVQVIQRPENSKRSSRLLKSLILS